MERKRPLLRLFVGPPARTQWSGWLVVSGSRRKCFFYASGTFSIRSGLLAPVHSFATDDTRGIFLWWFFLLMTGISMILFYQMKQQASSQQLAAGFRPAMRQIASGGHCGVAECRAVRPYSV
ncbi:unnamed protein product [Arabidopsis thaliana]|uniref:Transmembrane protein n=1 Tax=Arabidopsis thaliana TaxID=3702 RepID=A0A654GFI9_ARATH|nr:unnamed protein product [Arabidopsis thaliana]VYS71787.1 unnamed protein product [Arabidopsis thaliana]